MLGCGVICFMISSSLQRVSISVCIASSATTRGVMTLTFTSLCWLLGLREEYKYMYKEVYMHENGHTNRSTAHRC